MRDLVIRPGAVRQGDVLNLLGERLVAVHRHGGTALLIPFRLVCGRLPGRFGDVASGGGNKSVMDGHGEIPLKQLM